MSQARQRLIDTAATLFYRHGCHATGIDTLLAQAGVAKMTLYKHFGSKDALVAEVVRQLDERFVSRCDQQLADDGRPPAARLLGLFDAVGQWAASDDFFGCPFVNVSAEFAAPDDPVHQAAAANKQRILQRIEQLTQATTAPRPQQLARQLQILLEGAVVLTQVTGDRRLVRDARQAAAALLTEPEHAHNTTD